MKNKISMMCVLILLGSNCRMPSDPIGEIKILNRIDVIDTGGDCLDVGVDIEDGVVVAAANYNGYFIYELVLENGIIQGINESKTIHVSSSDMFASQGDNRAQTIDLSTNHDIAFIMDQYDHIWLYKYGDDVLQYTDNFLNESSCYSGTWLDVAIDDDSDRIGVYSLIKHNAAETTDDCSSLETQNDCEDQTDLLFCTWNVNENNCESDQAVEYLEYSTSLVWSNLESIQPHDESLDGDFPSCEYIINQGSIADKVFFNDGLLSLAYGELGVKIFEQANQDVCLVGSEVIDFQSDTYKEEDDFCKNNYMVNSEINYKNCCTVTACPQGIEECPWLLGQEGLGGVFSSAGGIIPRIYAEFDFPGEVESIFSLQQSDFSDKHVMFLGLSNSNGCTMMVMNGSDMENSIDFAKGYTIKGVHVDNDLLVLAAGHDGILLYDWNLNSVSFRGRISTSYANSVKVADNIIFVATEDGLEVIQIK